MHIHNLADIKDKDRNLLGGKAFSLSKLINAGIPVPEGFVIDTKAFINGMDPELKESILSHFDALNSKRVAVRSSAVAEDSNKASLAGQLDTFLNVPRDKIIESVVNCWNSIKSDRAVDYARRNNIKDEDYAVAVIIQPMIDSDISGVLFTANPINKSRNEYVVESIFGLGELLVQGAVTPETLVINSQSYDILQRSPHNQNEFITYSDNASRTAPLPKEHKDSEILNKTKLKRLISTAKEIEKIFREPQDIEWAFMEGSIYILQSRPITTL